MSKRSAFAVAVAVGFSLWGCSDEKAGPGVGPDVSWKVVCAEDRSSGQCNVAQQPHGPLDGRDAEDENDDYTLKATCSKEGSGLSIKIEDPGRDKNVDKQQSARPRSILQITRGKPGSNECVVAVTEYPLSGEPAELKVQENCAGNSSGPGTCEFEGGAGNGYAFEGTIKCDAMKYKGNGAGAWALAAATSNEDPVILQISDCN